MTDGEFNSILLPQYRQMYATAFAILRDSDDASDAVRMSFHHYGRNIIVCRYPTIWVHSAGKPSETIVSIEYVAIQNDISKELKTCINYLPDQMRIQKCL